MKSPFKFLDSYTREDREIFFGREKEITELYRKVFESKILLVYGISGTGKSSLINCGLAGKFSESDWLPVVVRRGSSIVNNMASGIAQLAVTSLKRIPQKPEEFLKAVKSIYLDLYKPVFFIFDQFEELFIFGTREEQEHFILIIKTLLASDLQCRFIFILREEYLAHLSSFEKAIPGFFSNRMRIEKMSQENAIEAIKGPCRFGGISVESGFAEMLMDKLCPNESEVELTYLQVFLDKIFKLATQSANSASSLSFSNQLLEEAGNVTDILGDFLDEQVSLQPEPEIALAVLKAFVSAMGTRQPMDQKEVNDYIGTIGQKTGRETMINLLQTFVNLRILQDKDQHEKYELRHDALAAKIYEKFTLVEKELLEVRQFVENAFYSFETRGKYLNKEDLEYIGIYENKLILPKKLGDFVDKSRQKLHARRKSLVMTTRISAVIFILILASVFRYYLKNQKYSDVKESTGLALLQSYINPIQGLTSALNIWNNDSSSLVLRYVILKNFISLVSSQVDTSNPVHKLQQDLNPVKLKTKILNAQVSRKGNYIFGWTEKQSAFVWKYLSDSVYYFKIEGELLHMEMHEEDSLIALVYTNNEVIVSDFHGKKHFAFKTSTNELMNESLVRFFPSKEVKLLAIKDNTALIYDGSGEILFELKGHTGRLNSVDISRDGMFIATASSDKTVNVWYYNYKTKQYSIYTKLSGHKDAVWSCEFNRNGKYLLTASADSTIRIWDLNGKQINPYFFFDVNNNEGWHQKQNNGEFDEDASNPEFSMYYRKFCNASFSNDEMVIKATSYQHAEKSHDNNLYMTNQVLFFDGQSKLVQGFDGFFIESEHNKAGSIKPEKFNQIDVSPNGRLAAVTSNMTGISLISAMGLRLFTANGTYAMFSKDGKDLIWISNDEIHHIPVEPGKISNLLQKYQISSGLRSGQLIFTGF
jgi:hypothetical protein